jgi:hypothetical protein
MSYALIRPPGFGATFAPSTSIVTSGASKLGVASGISAPFSSMPLLPTRSQVATDLEPYIYIADTIAPPSGFDPTNPDTWTPERMIPYGIRMVQGLQKHLGLAPVELQKITEIVKGELKWLDELGVPLTTIPTNIRDLAVLFARCSAVAACKQLGIPPEIGTATVDALSDGEFTNRDVESIGGVAGGMGGSYVCGLIGLPPQLGGYIGSFAGKVVGGLVSDALDIGGGTAERAERRRQQEEMRRAVKKQLEQIRGQYQSMVVPLVRTLYWEVFDHMLEDLENFWEKTECTTGVTGVLPPVRFPLLWGAGGLVQALPSTEAPFLRHTFDASRCPPQNYKGMRDPALCLGPGFIPPGAPTGCPSMFGCPYPTFSTVGAGGAERVAQAFAAYNVWWMQPGNRAANTDAWKAAMPEAPSRIVNFIARRSQERQSCKTDTCRRYADRDIGNYIGEYNEILGAAVESAGPNEILATGMRIQADIVASGSVYASANALRAETNAIRSGNTDRIKRIMGRIGDPKYVASLQREVVVSRAFGAVMNGALNYGLPALGAVMIAGALLKRRS